MELVEEICVKEQHDQQLLDSKGTGILFKVYHLVHVENLKGQSDPFGCEFQYILIVSALSAGTSVLKH